MRGGRRGGAMAVGDDSIEREKKREKRRKRKRLKNNIILL